MKQRRILVTSALPYANGDIHIGHLLEYIQTDIWVRFQRLLGHECHYVCADDAHGAAVMLKAEAEGVTPEELIDPIRRNHERDLRAFGVDFSNYYTTHSPENRAYSERIYLKLKANGYITSRTIRQLYDPVRGMFLADRFVKGECPQCHSPDQYGDSCEVCGSTYRATDLRNPRSTISGAEPELRETDHDFFTLPQFSQSLRQWHASGSIQASIRNKLAEWFTEGLQDWDITRDAPYFGFPIPGTKDKFFYVWLDAPVGYIASFANYCASHPHINVDDFWLDESSTELYHFIGKDIVYFHTLFWPAMLEGAGFRRPSGVFAHGFVSINGEKMSKSRGTFITASDFLQQCNPEYLRYYFAAKLNDSIEDIDFDLTDFVIRVNSELGGKLVNIAARSARFINQYFDHHLSRDLGDFASIVDQIRNAAPIIVTLYESRQYSRVIKQVMAMADTCNACIDTHAPWKKIKEHDASGHAKQQVHQLTSAMLESYWLMIGYLAPILPNLFAQSQQLLGNPPLTHQSIAVNPLSGATIQPFVHLFKKIDPDTVNALITKK